MSHNRRSFLRQSTLAAAGLLIADPLVAARLNSSPAPANGPDGFRFRQIHLDYHTSELIQDIATQFDPDEFVQTLKKASVNSVTCFGRCHHGMIYHDTKKFAERRHPYLKRNLLKEQIEACHKQNIRVPVYVTVQWDHFTAQQHPEWLMRDEEGKPFSFQKSTFDAGFYDHLDIATPYRDFLKSYLADLFEQVPVDGLFLDIHHVYPNAHPVVLEGMKKAGIDAAKAANRHAYYGRIMQEYKADIAQFVRQLDPKAGLFFNGGHVGPGIRSSVNTYSHLELESLPSGGWGYLHFPLTARYARNLDKAVMGMTGKFHTSWGDFHSLKNPAALELECFTMLALNAKCSVGDQLHPRGRLDAATYDLIGGVYAQVDQKEPWCEGAVARTDIGVFSTEEFTTGAEARTPDMMLGAVRMLQEGRHQFDIIDSQSELSGYRVLILPDAIPVSDSLRNKLSAFVAKGGALLVSYQSGLNPDKTGERRTFNLPELGLACVGDAAYSPDFLALNGQEIGRGLPATELVMYLRGLEVKPTGATVLAQTNVPYFNRTWEHFNSHKHTPSAGRVGYPAVTQQGRVIYFAHPVFTQYARNAPRWCRQLVLNALDRLLPDPLLQTPGAPSTLVATLNEQPRQQRQVVHLLNYVPERRGSEFDTVEDVPLLTNTRLSVRLATKPRQVLLVPEGVPLKFTYTSGRVETTIPAIRGHQMVALVGY
ncbi:beta-galactosidase [Rudanella paleaurantiibacter]|uniref:Beta-galactosidase n=1 Tax=Rudanella paleaurantiibacter TaxID=2614655 RepID=A0A7J5TT30_9BACT|nr:alpha-amylase family protein [Rudanella paleaurantiibacter]KAB7726864.1 beta-galactosidase [Rudanella paleaurantiibacter]